MKLNTEMKQTRAALLWFEVLHYLNAFYARRSKLFNGLVTAFRVRLKQLQEMRSRAAQRRQLASLDDRMLKDIGVSRYDAQAESAKKFWQS